MSESILKILLEELKTVQIVCHLNDCGAVVELSLDRLKKAEESDNEIRCPMCKAVLMASHTNAIGELARSITKIVDRRKDVEVRFVIPQK